MLAVPGCVAVIVKELPLVNGPGLELLAVITVGPVVNLSRIKKPDVPPWLPSNPV